MRSITLRLRRDELSQPEDAALKAAAGRPAGATFKPKAHAAAWLSAGAILKPEKPLKSAGSASLASRRICAAGSPSFGFAGSMAPM